MLPAVAVPSPFALGDTPGHPFRGNQYSDVAGEGGGGGGSSSGASAYATEPRIFAQPHEVAPVTGWPGEAVRHHWIDPETGKASGRLLTGEPLTREQIPDTLYHVTTNAPAVHSSGVLLGQVDGGGLGGGQANGVSFTTSKEDAHVIQRELRRALQIARGDLDLPMLEQFAREDEKDAGVPAGTLNDAVTFAKEMWNGNAFTVDHDWQEDPTGKYADEDRGKTYGHIKKRTPEDRERVRRSLLKDTFNAYLQMRGHQDKAHPSLKNPILFARQEKLAKLSPDDVQTLTIPSAQIPAKALVTTGSDDFLHEVRAYADVPLARATTLAYREKFAFLLGDVEGHPFRGNQYTDGGLSGDEAVAAIHRGEPHLASERAFVEHHVTGSIPSDAYKKYEDGDFEYIHKKEFGTLLDTRTVNGETVEIRLEEQPARYVSYTKAAPPEERDRLHDEYVRAAKALGTDPMSAGIDLGHGSPAYESLRPYEQRWLDSGEHIVRDADGLAVYVSPEEVRANGWPTHNHTVGAFVGDKAVGYAGDEFGATGVYLAKPYQRQGIGLTLLKTYLEKSGRLAKGKQLGQMTPAGRALTAALHRQLVKDAASKDLAYRDKLTFLLGGPGSGNFGHAGRPGEIGGSAEDAAGEGGGGGGQTAPVPVLRNVDSHANRDDLVQRFLKRHEEIAGAGPSPTDVQAAEAELRALPLIHGTTVAGALGALESELQSHADMEPHLKAFQADVEELRAEILAGPMGNANIDDEDWSGWNADEIQRVTDLDRRDATALAGKVHELVDLEKVIQGTTFESDQALGLDHFVFMTHGEKHPDYGQVGVVIDNDLLHDAWVSPKDIAAGTAFTRSGAEQGWTEHPAKAYSPERIANYQHELLHGDDYFPVAAAAAGNATGVEFRSRDQLFEVKAPAVPASAVKGFVVYDDLDEAQRLSDQLARKGLKNKVLYVDSSASGTTTYLHNQLKAIQATGMWDDAAAEEHEGGFGGTFILRAERA